jgi:O-methyltransferase
MSLKKRLAATLFREIPLLDVLNENSRLAKWIGKHKNLPRFDDRSAFYQYLAETNVAGNAIQYLEFGVHQGASIAEWARLNSNPESRFFGFDSFEGLPEHWNRRAPKGTFSLRGKLPELSDPRITLIKGWFHETLPGFLDRFEPSERIVINIDCDLYSGALYILTMLHPHLHDGTIVIFDEFCNPHNEFRAFSDYVRSYCRDYEVVAWAHYAQHVAVRFKKGASVIESVRT